MSDELESRLIELEIRSEERREDMLRLEEFVQGYEGRIAALEGQINTLRSMVTEGLEDMPSLEDDKPPHY